MTHADVIEPDQRLAALEAAMGDRTRALEAALEQRTALLHELDHRVKNNLQLISSLMLIQARRTSDPAVRVALEAMLQRLHAIATVHRRLFDRDDLGRFEVCDFVRDLVSDLAGQGQAVRFLCELGPAHLPVRLAGCLALVVNELLAEALAAPGAVGIAVAESPACLRIEIRREGPPAAEPLWPESETDGLGLVVVDLLVRQLQGRLVREAGPLGSRAELILPGAGGSP